MMARYGHLEVLKDWKLLPCVNDILWMGTK